MTETENEIPAAPTVEEIIDYKDKYLRLLADVDNTRRRMQKEKHDMMRYAMDNVISDLLAPIDQLENALKFADQMSGEVKNWAMGFQMILNQFKEVLSSNGITPFVSEGEFFDSSKHEAVETEETDAVPDGIVLKEFIKGYRSGDRVIRAARVKVAKKIINQEKDHVNTEEKK
ncbi:MAG: nucleotide exchange factor GrpE [Rhabdochlamydiaceae bacterium]|jgi:molecular chaperone GrpE